MFFTAKAVIKWLNIAIPYYLQVYVQRYNKEFNANFRTANFIIVGST